MPKCKIIVPYYNLSNSLLLLLLLGIFFFNFLFYFILIRYFLHLHFQCYPKSSPYPRLPLPYPPIPTSWPWRSPVLRHIKFARPRGLSFQWWPTRRNMQIWRHMQLETNLPSMLIFSVFNFSICAAEASTEYYTFKLSLDYIAGLGVTQGDFVFRVKKK